MSFPLRNFAWIVSLALAITAAGETGVLNAAPQGAGRMGMDRRGAGRMADRQQRVQERFDKMCEFLNLDDAQKKQAQELFDSRREEMRALVRKVREDGLDREQARQQMRQSFEQHRKRFEALLTTEQLDKLKHWEEQHPQRRGRMEGRPGGRRGSDGPGFGPRQFSPRGPNNAREPLGGVLMDLRRRLELSDDQVAQFRELAGSTMEELFDKFSAVLDKDQQAKLQELRERVKQRREMQRDDNPGE